MRTQSARAEEVTRRWFVADAAEQPLGRLATQVASVLRGKHRPEFTPHADTGEFVIVINAAQTRLTGRKLEQKFSYRHSGRLGHLKAEPYAKLLERKPEFAIEKAVRGMLPKNALGRDMLRKLKVYAGATHPHVAQKPEPIGKALGTSGQS